MYVISGESSHFWHFLCLLDTYSLFEQFAIVRMIRLTYTLACFSMHQLLLNNRMEPDANQELQSKVQCKSHFSRSLFSSCRNHKEAGEAHDLDIAANILAITHVHEQALTLAKLVSRPTLHYTNTKKWKPPLVSVRGVEAMMFLWVMELRL